MNRITESNSTSSSSMALHLLTEGPFCHPCHHLFKDLGGVKTISFDKTLAHYFIVLCEWGFIVDSNRRKKWGILPAAKSKQSVMVVVEGSSSPSHVVHSLTPSGGGLTY